MTTTVISKSKSSLLPSSLHPLANKQFGIFWAGASLSSIGFWIQNVGQGWQILQLTGSPFLLGLVAFISLAPNLVFSLVGGVIADRLDRRHILLWTQFIYMASALLLGILTTLQLITVWQILLIALINGVVSTIYVPAWQTYIGDLAPEGQLRQAIALNSMQFNFSRVVGPTIGGLCIGLLGIAGSYYLNALSYVGVIAALLLIRPRLKRQGIEKQQKQNMRQDLYEILSYTRHHPMIQIILALQLVFAFLVFPYLTLLPVFADNIFHIGATGLGMLNSAAGIGALIGSLLLVLFTQRIHDGPRVLFLVSSIGGGASLCFAFVTHVSLALPLLIFLGITTVMSMILTNTTLQTMVPEAMRARVISLWILIVLGLAPFGNLIAGWIAQMIGASLTLGIGGAACLLGTLLIILAMNLWVPHKVRFA
jgi:MFS family permease